MTRATYSATPLLRSLVHRPQGVILVLISAIGWMNSKIQGCSWHWNVKVRLTRSSAALFWSETSLRDSQRPLEWSRLNGYSAHCVLHQVLPGPVWLLAINVIRWESDWLTRINRQHTHVSDNLSDVMLSICADIALCAAVQPVSH